jgi:hypothetical protein
MKLARSLIVLLIVVYPIWTQEQATLGWDLTYKSLLEQNKVEKNNWIWGWLAHYRSPAEKWITNWKGKPIVSSILIENPAFHAAEHQTMWFVRTKDEAFYWESTEGHETDESEEPISTQIYDNFYKEASSWQQLSPKSAAELPDQVLPGYMAFLSVYGSNGSKQMLLTMEDFVICLNKSCLPGPENMKEGRLMAALGPILIPEDEKNYRHKSEAEIARMTPDQRIDEQISEDKYHMRELTDKQYDLIRKYRLEDGLKGWSHLVELIGTYNPRRTRDNRYSLAVMMANDLDERVVRLRASPEGRSIIAAVERVFARMAAAGKRYDLNEGDLRWLKGVNLTDDAVRETLRVKYKIEISGSELLEFSNYLVKRDPTYPSWSEQDFIKDYSRINEAGSPAQVYVMRKPERFYQEYLTFKGQSKSPVKNSK